jgi:hypothetical protein
LAGHTRQVTLADNFEAKIKVVVDAVVAAARDVHAATQSTATIAHHTKEPSIGAATAATQANRTVQVVASAAEDVSVWCWFTRPPAFALPYALGHDT